MGSSAYDKANTRPVRLKLNLKTDADIIAHLERQESMQGYIKSLIRADMARAADLESDAPGESAGGIIHD